MSKVLNWCFIGCGKLGHIVADQILPSGRHKIVSAYTRRMEQCEEFALKYGAKACASAEEAIRAEGVDAVYIVTPHSSHYEYAKLALEMGKPVLCEKAFTVTAEETRELIALAKEKQLYLAEAMWTWFSPVANRVKKWLDDGEFGELTNVQVHCRGDGRGYARRVTEPAAAGGALLDVGVYSITYLYRLFGKPEVLDCRGVVADGIDWEEEIDLKFPGGEVYTTSASVRDPLSKPLVILEGTKARTEIPKFNSTNQAELVRADGTREKFEGNGNYLNEFDLAAQEICEGLLESRYVPLQHTLDIMEIMDDCRARMQLKYPFEQ